MANTRDIDAAKDRLVDSLSSARDVAVTAVRDDIAPAVAAAVEAARDATGPIYAEAASRAGDAMTALRSSDVAQSVASKAGRKKRRRWPIVAAVLGAGAAAATILKSRSKRPDAIDITDTSPAPTFHGDTTDTTSTDSTPKSATD
jgi:hypothetical protein